MRFSVLKFWARMPLLVLVSAVSFTLPGTPGLDAAPPRTNLAGREATRTAYVARELSPENLITLSAAVAADPTTVLLIDTAETVEANKAFLADYRPTRVVPVGVFPQDVTDLEKRFGKAPGPVYAWTRRPPRALWNMLFPKADTIIVCPAKARGMLLQAACLAGTMRAPLFVWHGTDRDAHELRRQMARWKPRSLHVLGIAKPLPVNTTGVAVTMLKREHEVAALQRKTLAKRFSPIRTLVVANPHDNNGMSLLAPLTAVRRRASLLLTNGEGSNVEPLVEAAVRRKELRKAETVILVADLEAIPANSRSNPILTDKDEVIEMEPLTPNGTGPFSFCVGRMFHKDQGVVALMLARSNLLANRAGPRRALVVSNPGSSLPLLETFSRQTARELKDGGYKTTAMFGKDVKEDELRKALPRNDIFLWEGHHNTLIRDWKFPSWTEPLPPSFVYLQSCLALKDYKVESLMTRGAVGVIGSSTRTYSASGGASSLAFFDALLHEDCNVGEALRHSKNFMLAYVMLKEKRLGGDAKRSGANYRAAWAFTLWGDPTLRLPAPAESERAKHPVVRHTVTGNTIRLHLPEQKLEPIRSDKYTAETSANARLAGLITRKRGKGERTKQVLPLAFVEVELPHAPAGKVPVLSGRLPSRCYVFNWDARLKRGYLLALPRAKDKGELRFRVTWDNQVEQSASR
jgi:hypothetical protein